MLLLAAILLVACGTNQNDGEKTLDSEEIKQLVHDYSVGNQTIKSETASITAKELVITDEAENKTTYELPKDEFFVSIAPFQTETHPCTYHSLTGCQGEMVEQEFDFYIEDEEGTVIVDEVLKSGTNGFVDLWLPRDKTFNVTIKHDNKQVESKISTYENDGTCITTMQLM